MKKILVILLIIISIPSFADNYNSIQTGNWNTSTTWNNGIPDGTKENIITISSGNIVTADNLLFSKSTEIIIENGAELIINTLDVNIDAAEAKKDFTFTVLTGGVLTINGNFTAAKDATIDISGSATITGNLDLTTPATINVDGDLTVNGIIAEPLPDITGTGTIISENVTYNNGVLPIELLNFNTYYDFDKTVITWSTATELNNDYFIIEYSVDGILWETLNYIQGAGNSNTILNYTYYHYTMYSYYYRLTQVDYDGTSETFDISFSNSPYINENIEYNVYDMMGRFIVKKKYSDIINYIEKGQIYLLTNGLDVKKIKF